MSVYFSNLHQFFPFLTIILVKIIHLPVYFTYMILEYGIQYIHITGKILHSLAPKIRRWQHQAIIFRKNLFILCALHIIHTQTKMIQSALTKK